MSTDEFEDPLENYEPPTFDDPLEEALATERVATIQTQPFASIGPDATVAAALAQLTGEDIACLLVVDDDRLMGLFSDRDVLNHVALELDDVRDRPVCEVMRTNPVYVRGSDSPSSALAVMAVSGYRHVPVLNDGDGVEGIVSPRRITEFLRTRGGEA